MDAEMLFIVSYLLNTTICYLCAGLLLFLKPLQNSSNRKYKIAYRTLAVATLIVGTGHLAALLFNNTSILAMGIFAFPILLIGASQAWMFTFLFIVLFRESAVNAKRLILHGLPMVVATVLYIIACIIWEDPVVVNGEQWLDNLHNPPLLIRTLFGLTYLVQLVIYTLLFFRERTAYRHELDKLDEVPVQLELRWVTRGFLSALGIGVLAFTLCFVLSPLYEAVVTSLFSIFYLAISICYVNYYYTSQTLDTNPAQTEIEESDESNESAALLAHQQSEELFLSVQELMQEERPYLKADFNRGKLAHSLFTNERYLADAIHKATDLSIQQYITRYRLDYACSALQAPDNHRTIEQIALESGFSSLRTFNRLFREVIGTTPGEFRKTVNCKL